MKQVLAFIFLFSSGFALAQIEENNPKRALYEKNKVKSIKIYESRRKNGEPGKKEKLIYDERYDTSGLITESFYYGGRISGEYHEQFKYDSLGNMTEHIGYVMGDPVSTYFTYKYDEKNRIIEKARDYSSWYYTYDSLGNMRTCKWLLMGEAYPEQFFLDSFQYNSTGQQIKMSRYTGGTKLYFFKIYGYDDAGNKISEVRFEHGEMTDTWVYYYDGNHHYLGQDLYDSQMNKRTNSFKVVYDANDLIISTVVDKHYRRYVYEYWP